VRFDCEINNGTVVTPQGTYQASIAVQDGRIAGISAKPSGGAARIIDADGLLILPGMVDLSNERISSRAGWTPFEGLKVKGKPIMTLLRGNTIAEHGKLFAEPGTGRFVRRE
jgi:dihydroorotase-like cyclic amidohydrolase